jgi:hypothetical protein
MTSETARPLVPREPFAVIRLASSVVLKYQGDATGGVRPEGIAISSQIQPSGVAIREAPQTTGSVSLSIIE